jgi:hypothetical protein
MTAAAKALTELAEKGADIGVPRASAARARMHSRSTPCEFLEEMERVVPWAVLVQVVEPYSPKAKTGRPPFGIQTMLRIHHLQQWFGL